MTFAIETTQLSKTYGQVRAVDSVNLQVRRGEIYGFLGRDSKLGTQLVL